MAEEGSRGFSGYYYVKDDVGLCMFLLENGYLFQAEAFSLALPSRENAT
jgi:hypothetical protein